jgi:hypothetical protein
LTYSLKDFQFLIFLIISTMILLFKQNEAFIGLAAISKCLCQVIYIKVANEDKSFLFNH